MNAEFGGGPPKVFVIASRFGRQPKGQSLKDERVCKHAGKYAP
jgi:hypothetical protein